MDESLLKLKSPPIIEAVLDIDCDLPPSIDLAALETAAQERLRDAYPIPQKRFLHAMQVTATVGEAPQVNSRHGPQALTFCAPDGKQLVQLRPQGYSFNRLAPYSSLDDYLPEIERTWRVFLELTAPAQVRLIRLRYINRLPLPAEEAGIDVGRFLKLSPRLPAEVNLMLSGFFSQHSAVDPATGNAVNIAIATEPRDGDKQPVILDIEAYCTINADPADWESIAARIQSLRRLKNVVFSNSLTDPCLDLFQHPH
jgi:uncharacterized protein (TIGR04255 family)